MVAIHFQLPIMQWFFIHYYVIFFVENVLYIIYHHSPFSKKRVNAIIIIVMNSGRRRSSQFLKSFFYNFVGTMFHRSKLSIPEYLGCFGYNNPRVSSQFLKSFFHHIPLHSCWLNVPLQPVECRRQYRTR